MCGIAGIYSYKGAPVSDSELKRICDHMRRRGPDGEGIWMSDEGMVGLGHRRLSIIDLSSAGAQPMHNGDDSLVITFNGEIYNYLDIRERLEKKGFRFRSNSDTEVLLHLYKEKGEAMLGELRGMFAFGIWDKEKKKLFLARDPYGIKPLYYFDDGFTLRFASQVKALLAGKGISSLSVEPAGHVGFFLWGSIPEPFSLYKGLSALPAGHYMMADASGLQTPVCYADVRSIVAQAEQNSSGISTDRSLGLLREVLHDTVRHHLIADVPVGVFLSSGLDSTTLAALTSESGVHQLKTVTLGFEEYRNTEKDEVPLAEQVAVQYGAQHETVWVERSHFRNALDDVLDVMDQPTIDGVNSYFVSEAAAQSGLKVALSGLGGDELFGSYPSFTEIPQLVRQVNRIPFHRSFGRGFRLVTAPWLKYVTSPKWAGVVEYGGAYGDAYLLRRGFYMPWELPSLLDPDLVREGWNALNSRARLAATVSGISTGRLQISTLESTWYMRNQLLRDTDWASMAHSLEIRVPLVDWHLLKTVLPLILARPDLTKRNMAESPTHALPATILNRPKSGFSIPVREWLTENAGESGSARGLRGWGQFVYNHFTGPV